MPVDLLDRAWFDALVNDDGSDTVGTKWNKARIAELLNSIDAHGAWQTRPFNAANFFAVGGTGTWTVNAAAVLADRYSLTKQKTLLWKVYVSWFSGSSVVAGAGVTGLGVTVPFGSIVGTPPTVLPVPVGQEAGVNVEVNAQYNANALVVTKKTGAVWTASTVGFAATFQVELI